jgi:hypothetical protein
MKLVAQILLTFMHNTLKLTRKNATNIQNRKAGAT